MEKDNKIKPEIVAPVHSSGIKSNQALAATEDYLNNFLKIMDPKEYQDCKLSVQKTDAFGDPSEIIIKENGQPACTLEHDSNTGRITATFNSSDLKYADLALFYIKKCGPDRVQLTGITIGERHDIVSTLLTLKAGTEVDKNILLEVYKLARIEGYKTNISDEEAIRLFGEENILEFKKYKNKKKAELEKLRQEQESKKEEKLFSAIRMNPGTIGIKPGDQPPPTK